MVRVYLQFRIPGNISLKKEKRIYGKDFIKSDLYERPIFCNWKLNCFNFYMLGYCLIVMLWSQLLQWARIPMQTYLHYLLRLGTAMLQARALLPRNGKCLPEDTGTSTKNEPLTAAHRAHTMPRVTAPQEVAEEKAGKSWEVTRFSTELLYTLHIDFQC